MTTKSCFIPFCMNTSNNSDKIFLSVPKDANRRKAWFDSFSNQSKINTSTLYCCEDHFDLQKDAKNWWFYVSMGSKLLLQEHVVPHKYLTLQDGIPPVGSQFTESARKRRLETQKKLENTRKRPKDHKKLSSRNSSQEDRDEDYRNNQEINFVEIKCEKMNYECDKCDYATDFFNNYQTHQNNCTGDVINNEIIKTELAEINNKRKNSKRKYDKKPECNSTENNVSDIVIKEECEVSSTDDYDIIEQDQNLIEDVYVKTEQNVVKQEIDDEFDQKCEKDEEEQVEVYLVLENSPKPDKPEEPLRLTGRHFPGIVNSDEGNPCMTRLCVVCAAKKRNFKMRSEYLCKTCNVGLCAVPCFEIYHTRKFY